MYFVIAPPTGIFLWHNSWLACPRVADEGKVFCEIDGSLNRSVLDSVDPSIAGFPIRNIRQLKSQLGDGNREYCGPDYRVQNVGVDPPSSPV